MRQPGDPRPPKVDDISTVSRTPPVVASEDRTTDVERGTMEKPSEAPVELSKAIDPFLVTIDGREHLSPKSWSSAYRSFLTALAGLLVLNSSGSLHLRAVQNLDLGLSYSLLVVRAREPHPRNHQTLQRFAGGRAADHLHLRRWVSDPVAKSEVLLSSAGLYRYMVGPLVFGPLSERVGRRRVFCYSFGPFFLLQIGCALGSLLNFCRAWKLN